MVEIGWTDDPVRDAERYYDALYDEPMVCERCGAEVGEEFYEYHDSYYCVDCFTDMMDYEFKRYKEDYR